MGVPSEAVDHVSRQAQQRACDEGLLEAPVRPPPVQEAHAHGGDVSHSNADSRHGTPGSNVLQKLLVRGQDQRVIGHVEKRGRKVD